MVDASSDCVLDEAIDNKEIFSGLQEEELKELSISLKIGHRVLLRQAFQRVFYLFILCVFSLIVRNHGYAVGTLLHIVCIWFG